MKNLFVALTVLAMASFASAQMLEGNFPAEGGNISVTASGGDVAAAGLDFNSAGGNLIPAPGTDASPFTFFLANTANQVTYGNLGTSVTFADGSTTELSVGAAAGADDITASWGMGATPVAFQVRVVGGEVTPVEPVDLSGLSPIFAPGNTIYGGQVAEGAFNIGGEGFSGNQWPGGEAPANAINGTGQKYLNFGKENTGFLVTPDNASVVSALKFWAANDAIPRDPASYEIWGTNGAIDASEGFLDVADFTAISVGDINLPDSRNDGGEAALDEANSFAVAFENSDTYSSYLVVFPTLKDSAGANSMQIADVQAFGAVVPEPASSTLLALAGLAGLCFRRRR